VSLSGKDSKERQSFLTEQKRFQKKAEEKEGRRKSNNFA